MKFLGIDPSLRNTAIVQGHINEENNLVPLTYKLIQTTKSKSKKKKATDDLIDRCRSIYIETQALINGTYLNDNNEILLDYASPDFIFIESPSGSQSANAAKSYAISCFLIATLYPEAYTVTPNELKVKSQGSKTATKHEMVEWVQNTYPDFKLPAHAGKVNMSKAEHVADAVAAAHVGYNKLIS